MTMTHHVFVVEDHPLMRDMVAAFVAAQPHLYVCGSARTAEDALEQLPSSADLILVDIALPGMSGIDLIREICGRWDHISCLVCSGHAEVSYAERALEAGADGYVAKGNPAELADAIQCLIRGEHYLSASLRERTEFTSGEPNASGDAVPDAGCGPITVAPETQEAERNGS